MIEWVNKIKKFKITGESELQIPEDFRIGSNCKIQVDKKLKIGKDCSIGDNCVIKGVNVDIGDHLRLVGHAEIGGGSCFDPSSSLKVGDHFHLGKYGFINTARSVVIGDEVGLGMGSKIFTHGAYLSVLEGFPVSFAPVTLGNRVWCPGAIINPGVTIGNDVVIGVGSVVTHDIPSNSLAVGVPAKVIKSNYPKIPNSDQKSLILQKIIKEATENLNYKKPEYEIVIKYHRSENGQPKCIKIEINNKTLIYSFNSANDNSPTFLVDIEHHDGVPNEVEEIFTNQLRRYGIRLKKDYFI